MKAIIRTGYGGPEVLQLTEVEKPALKDGQVLVRIRAASTNPADYHSMRGGMARILAPLIVHENIGMRKPKDRSFGSDIAGVVETIGNNVTQFKPGDEVFGTCAKGCGGFAEYAAAREGRLAMKPAEASFEEAAAVPIAGLTALQGLRDKGRIQPGQKVLVNGASGGIGTFAVQIAKSYGTEVTGVCSTRNLDMVHKIGADHVIDYTKEDFSKNGQRYDIVCDAVGNHSVSDYKRALKPEGICVILGFYGMSRMLANVILGGIASKTGEKKVGMMLAHITPEDLNAMKQLIEAGKVRPVIDRTFPLSETADAIRYCEGEKSRPGHARGKVIITMNSEPTEQLGGTSSSGGSLQ
jgi:NADPH:quinone reductase-like Zn-dependent oxidoreductase